MTTGNQEWAMWANEHAFVSGVVMVMGGITGSFGFDGAEFAYYSIVAGVFVCFLEYARSCRRKGSIVERRFQSYLHPLMHFGSPILTNYYLRFILYLVLCIPCAFQLPTLIGGISLLLAALIYFKAALGGESWNSVQMMHRKSTRSAHPPNHPPPRPAPRAAGNNSLELEGKINGGAEQ